MTPAQFVEILKDPQVASMMRAMGWTYAGGGLPAGMSALKVLNDTYLTVKALGEIVARESSNPAEVKALLAALPQPQVDSDALAAALAPKLVSSLPADSPITDDQLARVLRSVLGSLDTTQG